MMTLYNTKIAEDLFFGVLWWWVWVSIIASEYQQTSEPHINVLQFPVSFEFGLTIETMMIHILTYINW